MRVTKLLVPLIAVAGLLPSAQTSEAAFPGGEGLIAFESTRTGNREVFVVREDGSGLANLTNHPLADGDPAWNAAGDKIVFTSQRDGHTDIWVMSGGGGVIGNMTPGALTGLAPAWSPDDTEIAYIYNHDLWVLAADGSGTTRNISNSPDVQESEPTWSPDGSVIAFRHRSPQATDIWTVQPDGSNPTNITQTPQPEADERKPSYTGDGTTIVYERFGDIWKMSVDGTGQANLTDDFSGGGLDPSASPSGERIVFTSSADNNEELFVMNADGTDITRLTSVAGEDENPDWQATDPPPGLSIHDSLASEGSDGPAIATFGVTLSEPSEVPVSVRYETRDGTAKEGQDYDAASGTLDFDPGETEQSLAVTILPDPIPEREERFKVRLLEPEGARLVRSVAAGIIVEAADVAVDLSDSKDPVRNNGRFVYSVEVSNAGPSSASDTKIYIALPRSVDLETARVGDKACDLSGPRITCSLGRLEPGASKTATIKVTAGPASQTVFSEVHVGSAESDPLPSNNFDGETTEISPRAPRSLTAALDTYVPPRFTDVDSDGFIDETFNRVEDMDQPFLILFHACDSGPAEEIVQYRLEITVDDETTTHTSELCDFDTPGGVHFNPPGEGTYPVKLTVTTAGGETDVLEKDIRFRDYFVVSLGDSVGSGEGNPDKPCTRCASCVNPVGPCHIDVQWSNGRCHRSPDAGSAQAARTLENASSLSSVTFVHLACSGSSIAKGILTPYPGIDDEVVGHPYFGTELEPQIDIVEEMMEATGRVPDAIVISGGANDARFGHLVARCLGLDKCHLDGEFVQEVKDLMAALPDRYRDLEQRLEEMNIPDDRVYFTEYFDPTRDETGNFGKCMTFDFLFGSASLISAAEWEWAYHNVIKELNRRVFAGTQAHGWNYVGGIASAFERHGYCSKDPWIRSLPESLVFQAGIHGSFHPNLEGHGHYGRRIYNKLSQDLD